MIGILAGMGPRSTGPFVDTVVDQCQKIYGAKYDMDFPHMMIYSCPTPFYLDREIDHEKLADSIVEGAIKLESTGVQIIAMPCNTAHLYMDKLRSSLSIQLVDMVSETIKELPESTINSGIYQDHLISSGYTYIQKVEWQEKVTNTIRHIKDGDIDTARYYWNTLLTDLNEEVDTVIIACTELNVVLEKQEGLFIVDSSICLAKALVNSYILNR